MRVGLVVSLALLAGGCAVEYRMRINRFESPEVSGEPWKGTVTAAAGTAHELRIVPEQEGSGVASSSAEFRAEARGLVVGLGLGVAKRWDIVLWPSLADSASSFGVKYQIVGEPRTRARRGNFSLAATLSPGYASLDQAFLPDGETSFDGDVWSLDGGVIAGYRLTDGLLAYGGPFASFHALHDADFLFGDRHTPVRGDGHDFGFHIGLRYETSHFAALLELAWSEAEWGDADNSAVALGGGLSFSW